MDSEPPATLADFLPQFREYLGMYVPRCTYLSVCAFVAGYRWGAKDDTLGDFSEWMSERVATRPELGWPWLVLCELYPADELPDPVAFTDEQDAQAIEVLFGLLFDYYGISESTH
ncbi:hypothetical protein [Cellulomonas composti]|uniref:hypothetical protein n=1 Tax=Cellulomonas composti TaxID=266130 RepID=UPI0011BF7949|nr:hypothetical protein [Cellulomonas composti]